MAELRISQDKELLDLDLIVDFLSTAYWSKGRTRSMIKTTIEHSICFGMYLEDRQIGFARTVTDHVVFAYLMDVFILSEYRGNGYGSQLMDHIINNSELNGIQNWMLATSDAHGLYEKFGFKSFSDPNKMMCRISIQQVE